MANTKSARQHRDDTHCGHTVKPARLKPAGRCHREKKTAMSFAHGELGRKTQPMS